MLKKLLSVVLALLLLVFALFSFVTAFFSTMEWIRVHINLISAMFNGNLESVFNSMFAYYGVSLNSPWLAKVINFLSYNIALVVEYVVALIAFVGGLAIIAASLSSSKTSKLDKSVEDLAKKFDKLQLISEAKAEAPAKEEKAE
jgi:predicted small integral membrane protein